MDQDGKVVGYGTISTDGKSFRNQDWHTAAGESSTQFDAKHSNDLSAYNYTAPEFQDGTNASIVAAHEGLQLLKISFTMFTTVTKLNK